VSNLLLFLVQPTDFDSFFDEVARITAPDYIPSEADVLRARTKTTGIYETRFTMGQLSILYVTSTFDLKLTNIH
jgi:hypothetical protein